MNRTVRLPVELNVIHRQPQIGMALWAPRIVAQMPRRRLGALVGCGILVWAAMLAPAWGQDAAPLPQGIQRLPPPAADSAQIDALVAQLASESWSARQEASERLIAIGAAALPALEEHRRTTPDLQIHSDIEMIEAQIALRLAEGGKPIYVRFESADAIEALREIAQQAGVTVQIEERRLRGLTLDGEIVGLTWWPAILHLAGSNDLDVRPGEGGLRITRATDGPSPTLGGPMSATGPLLVLARGSRYERSVAFDRNPVLKRDGSIIADEASILRQTQFFYDFDVMLEPRFALSSSRRFTLVLTGAQDDAGNSLLASGTADGTDLSREIADAQARAAIDDAMSANLVEAEWSGGKLRFAVPLRYPASPGARLRIEGRVRGLAGAEICEVQASALDLSNGISWYVAAERVNLRLEASSAAGRWVLTVESARAVSPEVGDLLAASFAGAELTDTGENRFRRGGTQSSMGDDGHFTARIEFIGPAEDTMIPRSLRCRVPRRAVELDLPFAFESLPMP